MKKIIVASISAISAAMICAAPASAQSVAGPKFYGNLGYTFVDGDSDVNFGAITGRLGARLHQNFGVEGEAAIGVDGDKTTLAGVTVETKLKHSFGAYVVGYLPVTPQLDLFARGGYGTSRIKASARGVSVSDSEDSWNYGAGAQYSFDGLNGLRAEYTRHDFGNGAGAADTFGVSYVRKF